MNDLYKTGSMIENFLSMLLTKAKISSIISFDETPLTISSDSTDMIVVDVLSVNDYGNVPPTYSSMRSPRTVWDQSQ